MPGTGSRSKFFRKAVKFKDEPHKFVEFVSRLLGPRGKELRTWSREYTEDELVSEINRVLKEGVLDEWQFLFTVTKAGVRSDDDGATDSAADAAPCRAVTDHVRVQEAHRHRREAAKRIIGEAFTNTIDELVEYISSSLLTETRRLIVISGPPRSGKTLMLEHVCEAVKRRTGVDVVDMRENQGPAVLFSRAQLVYLDDADIEVVSPVQESHIEKYYRSTKVAPVVILTARDVKKIVQVMENCHGKVFAVPEFTSQELYEIMTRLEVGGFRLCPEPARRVANLLTALRTPNQMAAALDCAVYLMYPVLQQAYDGDWAHGEYHVSFSDQEVRDAIRKATGISLEPKGKSIIAKLGKQIRSRIVGQDSVVEEITPLLATIASGLTDPTKPAGSIFAFGPTGVGKTLLAQVIADLLFDGRLHKEDMNTFSERHSISRITGAPPGYLGYNDTPAIIEFIGRNRRGVILLDEIEKAHPVVHDHIMELLDTGFIRDTRGALHDVRGFLILMTSNVTFANRESRKLGFSHAEEKKQKTPREELIETNEFKREFIGRLQVICKYEALDKSKLEEIASLILAEMSARMISIGIRVKKTKKLLERIVASYDEKTGARSMRTFCETVIKAEILQTMAKEEGNGS